MAIAKMEKLALTFKAKHLDKVLHMMQGFNGIHIETKYESTVPSATKLKIDKEIGQIEKNLQDIQAAYSVLKGRESTDMFSFLKKSEERQLKISELESIVEESNWQQIHEEIINTDRWLQNTRKRRKEVSRLLDELKIWEYMY